MKISTLKNRKEKKALEIWYFSIDFIKLICRFMIRIEKMYIIDILLDKRRLMYYLPFNFCVYYAALSSLYTPIKTKPILICCDVF